MAKNSGRSRERSSRHSTSPGRPDRAGDQRRGRAPFKAQGKSFAAAAPPAAKPPAHRHPAKPIAPAKRVEPAKHLGPAKHVSPAKHAHGQPSGAHRREELWIYGHHAVAAALANPQRKILRAIATAEAVEKLRNDASAADNFAHVRTVSRRDIEALVGEDAVHQGIAILVRPLEHDLGYVLDALSDRSEACLVVLDQVTDPHNVGAVLRSAAAFGASAVIAPDRHAPDESPAMAKAASGALDRVPYIKTVNLVRALESIKEARFWVVGLDTQVEQPLAAIKLSGRIAFVLGAEDEGLRRLVSETCDHLARLPIHDAVESLNVSNASAIALYERARQITADNSSSTGS